MAMTTTMTSSEAAEKPDTQMTPVREQTIRAYDLDPKKAQFQFCADQFVSPAEWQEIMVAACGCYNAFDPALVGAFLAAHSGVTCRPGRCYSVEVCLDGPDVALEAIFATAAKAVMADEVCWLGPAGYQWDGPRPAGALLRLWWD
jgi:hypothetical protein